MTIEKQRAEDSLERLHEMLARVQGELDIVSAGLAKEAARADAAERRVKELETQQRADANDFHALREKLADARLRLP